MNQEIKSWKRQFFECKKIADTPPLNKKGFWDKPKHGIKKELEKVDKKP